MGAASLMGGRRAAAASLLLCSLLLQSTNLCLARSGRSLAGDTLKLRILHINDVHARYEAQDINFQTCSGIPSDCFGGFAKLSEAVKEEREAAAAAGEDILLLHAGDQFEGSLWDLAYAQEGKDVSYKFLDALGVDAITLGDTEFAYGVEHLAAFIDNTTAPALSCNLGTNGVASMRGKVHRYLIRLLPVSGAKVAIIGLTTIEAADNYPSVKGSGLELADELQALPGCIAEARDAGADIIILLSHVGAEMDLQLAADPAFADVDLIIGGHSHSLFYGPGAQSAQQQTAQLPLLLLDPPVYESATPVGPYPMSIANGMKTIPVTSAFWGTRYLGVMKTTWTGSGDLLSLQGSPKLLGDANSPSPVGSDPTMEALVATLQKAVAEVAEPVVGYTDVYLTGPVGEPNTTDAELPNPAAVGETNLGDLVTDALLWYAQNNATISDDLEGMPWVALIDAASLQKSLPMGPVTKGEIMSIVPLNARLVIKQLDSNTLLGALNSGLSTWSATNPGGTFPQVGGMKLTFNSSAPASSRLLDAWFYEGTLIEGYNVPIAVLTLSTLGAPSQNLGDRYRMVWKAPTLLDTKEPVYSILLDYFGKHVPITARKERRIVDCSPDGPGCVEV